MSLVREDRDALAYAEPVVSKEHSWVGKPGKDKN